MPGRERDLALPSAAASAPVLPPSSDSKKRPLGHGGAQTHCKLQRTIRK
jgi:hypothetical protein